MKHLAAVLTGVILSVICTACNNFFHELIPPDDNRISEFKLEGQTDDADINNSDNIINIPWNDELSLAGKQVINRVSVPLKASLLPLTKEYLQEAFPSIENFDDIINMIAVTTDENLTSRVTELIKQNKDFTVPALDKPIDFSRPVTLLVISGHGPVRRYTTNKVYYVKFESNGGSSVKTINAAIGETIIKPKDPVRKDYTFGGWYIDNNTFEQPWDFYAYTVTVKITLYAKWEKIEGSDPNPGSGTGGGGSGGGGGGSGGGGGGGVEPGPGPGPGPGSSPVTYTVTFNSNGGSSVPSKTVDPGNTVPEPFPYPTKPGYNFDGWYRDNYHKWNFETDTVTGNTTLYAAWSPN